MAGRITRPGTAFPQPTGLGTLHSGEEPAAIARTAHDHGMHLFVDGARPAHDLGPPGNDVTMADLAAPTDARTIGGTKCGTMLGEAAVLVGPGLRLGLRNRMKQNGARFAKGQPLGVRFEALPAGRLYQRIGAERHCIRLCTSWSARDSDLDALESGLARMARPITGGPAHSPDVPGGRRSGAALELCNRRCSEPVELFVLAFGAPYGGHRRRPEPPARHQAHRRACHDGQPRHAPTRKENQA